MDEYTTEQYVVEHCVGFMEPVAPRTPFTVSRLAILPDRTTCPVLLMLARKKFGEIPKDQFPFWLDGDYTNETFGNVALAPKERILHRKLGIPGGPDYRKRWRAANRNRVRRYTRESQDRKALLDELEKKGG